jgi:hypothetical protein
MLIYETDMVLEYEIQNEPLEDFLESKSAKEINIEITGIGI